MLGLAGHIVMSAMLSQTQPDDSATVVAEIVEETTRFYLKTVWPGLGIEPEDGDDAAGVCEVARESGLKMVGLLAQANRLVSDATVEAHGRPAPPPEPVVKAMRDLTDSYALLAGVQNYDHLMHLPLVPPEKIRAELSDPVSRAWFAAVAA